MKENSRPGGLQLSVKSFLVSALFIFLMMAAVYVLTLAVPGGSYARIPDENGNMVIDAQAGFTYAEGGIPFWKWLLSPFLVLGASGNGTLISIILFLLMIGGLFSVLTEHGILQHMLMRLARRYGRVRYRFMAVVIFFFMAMGAFVGSFEEVIPLVPLVAAMAVTLGWDVQTGIAMSLLAVGCGFASGVANAFTVGVAQTIAGLPMFSGLWFRAVCFAGIYLLLLGFVYYHARRIARAPAALEEAQEEAVNPKMERGSRFFMIFMAAGITTVALSGFFPALADYALMILALTFIVATVSSTAVSGMKTRSFLSAFARGVKGIAPSILLILMASSIRYVMEESRIMDTLLHFAMEAGAGMSRAGLILFIYMICMVINFFVPSGSAEAMLLIPLIVPLAQAFGISAQLCIVAFAFGDGFSNILYPTNPALLVGLGLADCSYPKWLRFSCSFQLLNLVLTCGLLLLGLALGVA